ncbi:class I SAM-dependent methyltransferase [Tahibacter soli]|uniref:Class I SAM-dependent methyltransferase n=1 Tax=Tahibacter soli TaxID=2983605 RepID=A0A9X3YQ16_9GAMM|nr:class I SAM-dependent methyltransferase [Tahibacter soli]MDC8015370.1 class I SAM-dependent methyltransferase [Tahibacter soli]
MSNNAPNLFAADAVRRLLGDELRSLAPELAGVFGRQGLVVRAHAAAPEAPSAPMLGGLVRLHVAAPSRLAGDVDCEPSSLPFVDASFRLVLAQHAAEAVAEPEAFRSEIARVVEPGGILMVLGFQPFGAWRPWIAWQQFRGAAALKSDPAWIWREALADAGVDTYACRRLGPLWPRVDASGRVPPPLVKKALAPLRPSWLLLARKRSLGPTLIARKAAQRARAVGALASGTQRTSA